MADYLEFDPAEIERREIYRLLTGSVVPRPIGWASTVSGKGVSDASTAAGRRPGGTAQVTRSVIRFCRMNAFSSFTQ